MKKRFLSLTLALVMCFALVVPAFAASTAANSEAGVADAAEPRYAVYRKTYTVNLHNNTFVDVVMEMTDKNGRPTFYGLETAVFYTVNPNGSHWGIIDYNYTVNENEFNMTVKVIDMEGDTISSSEAASIHFWLTPEPVSSLSAEGGSDIISTVSIEWRLEGSLVLPTNDTKAKT